MSDFPIFSYRQGDTFVHKIPSWLKILFIPAFNVAVFLVDWRASLFFVPAFFALFCALRFPLREQLNDMKPVFYYGFFLYFVNFFVQFCSIFMSAFFDCEGAFVFLGFADFFRRIFDIASVSLSSAVREAGTAKFCVRFCACVQSCSLMFRTSSPTQIRYGIEDIEVFIRKLIPDCHKDAKFALAVSMLLIFIPTVFRIWGELTRAWKARGGKTSLRMILVLIPELFSVGLRFAYNTSRALVCRMSS